VKGLSILVTGILSLIAGIIIYCFRCRQQFYYGLVEVVFGAAVSVLSVFPPSSSLLIEDPSPMGLMISKNLTFAAGLYVVVRGLDNIDKAGWPEVLKPRRLLWNRLFHGPKNEIE
jgi:hypothetical protein